MENVKWEYAGRNTWALHIDGVELGFYTPQGRDKMEDALRALCKSPPGVFVISGAMCGSEDEARSLPADSSELFSAIIPASSLEDAKTLAADQFGCEIIFLEDYCREIDEEIYEVEFIGW